MFGNVNLAEVVCSLDDRADDGLTVEALMVSHNIDPHRAAYVAEQRALRIALMFDGWTPAEVRALRRNNESRRVKLTPAAARIVTDLAAAWLDGLATGLECPGANLPANGNRPS